MYCNTNCFSTRTTVIWTRLNVTLYTHCLSCHIEVMSMTNTAMLVVVVVVVVVVMTTTTIIIGNELLAARYICVSWQVISMELASCQPSGADNFVKWFSEFLRNCAPQPRLAQQSGNSRGNQHGSSLRCSQKNSHCSVSVIRGNLFLSRFPTKISWYR